MDKELEALKRIDEKNYLTEREHREFWAIVKKALLELKIIKESNPIEAFTRIEKEVNGCICVYHIEENDIDIVKQSLLKAQEQEKENAILKEIIRCFFDKGCPLHQYVDKDLGLTIEVDSECSNITLGEFKGVDLNKKLKEVLENENE